MDKNTEIFNVIEKMVTFLNSVDYNELLISISEVGFTDTISTYISLTFFLIKLCTNFRKYLKLIYSYFFRRLNYAGGGLASAEDLSAPTGEISLMDESDNLDYINLFEPRYYIDSINVPVSDVKNSKPQRGDPVPIIINTELETPANTNNLVYVKNILAIATIVTFAPDGCLALENKIQKKIPMTSSGDDIILPTQGCPFFDVETIIRKLNDATTAFFVKSTISNQNS